MGVESLGVGVKMKKGVIFTIRCVFGSVCNHPFLVGMLCLLVFLSRSSPFVFSLLVSTSPIFICTAVMLGTLLSFGQPNIPQVVIEDRTFHEAVSLKTAVSGNATVNTLSVERFSEKRSDIQGQSTVQPSLSIGKLGEVLGTGISDGTAPLIKDKSMERESENGEIWEATKELDDMRYKQKVEWNEERFSDAEVVVENHYSKMNGERVESDEERSEADSFDSERVNVDPLDSPPRSPWKRTEEKKEGDEEDGLDSGSDQAESSSPDASMADIMPMLDELHPLLDEDVPQTVNMSTNHSYAVSLRSSKSSTYSHDSDDETENNDDMEEEEITGDFIEDGEDEEDKGTKPAIIWTEEDEKNLMDLGSSEIERNQWLEKLIMRRRERKTMSVVPETNLIDLESSDLPFNVAPISTTRQNPFDLSRDSYEVPGSAPSVLVPRLNPFDIPYGFSEEKPNVMGGGLVQENFMAFQSREPFYRRRESFNVGQSFLAPNREERQDVRFRPYFVPERMVSEESSYSPLLRQSSEASDSKVSSGPETESLGSVEEIEDRKVIDEHDRPEVKPISTVKEVTEKSLSGGPELISKGGKVAEEDVLREPELIAKIEHVSEHIGHGSQSSEERYSTDSSFSSLSEISERIFIDTEGEGSSVSERRKDGNAGISRRPSVESTTIIRTDSDMIDEVAHKEPVYDSSPPSVRKNFSSSSISSDLHTEADIPIVVKRTVSVVERESEQTSQAIEKDISDIGILPESSVLHSVNEHKPGPSNLVNIKEPNKQKSEISGADTRTQSEGVSASHVHVQSESSIKASVETNPINQQTQGQVPRSISDENAHAAVKSSGDQNLGEMAENKQPTVSGRDKPVEVSRQPSESKLNSNKSNEKEETSENVENRVESPSSDSDIYHEAYEKLMLTPSAEGNPVSFFYDDKMHVPTVKQHRSEAQAQKTATESLDAARTLQELNMPVLQELDQEILSNVNSPLTPDFISIPSTASETPSSHTDAQTMSEEADMIREIDDGLFLELDSVGDFSINQWGSGSVELEKRIDSVEVNTLQLAVPSGKSRKEIDRLEEDMNRMSERKLPSERCIAETKQVNDSSIGNQKNPDSVDRDVKLTETQGTSSKLHEAESKPSETLSEPPKQLLDVNMEKQLKPNSSDRSAEVKARKVESSVEKESTTKESIKQELDGNKEESSKPNSDKGSIEAKAGQAKQESTTKETIKKELDGSKEEQLKPNSDKGSIEAKAGQVEKESTTKETIKKELDGSKEEQLKPNSGDRLAEVKAGNVESPTVKESTSIKQELDVNKEKQMKPETKDELAEVKVVKVESSGDKEPTIKETVKLVSYGDKEKQPNPESRNGLAEKLVKVESSGDKEPTINETVNLVSDGDKEKHPKPESRNGLEEVKEGKAESSVDKESTSKETMMAAAGKADHGVKAPEDESAKGKGKAS